MNILQTYNAYKELKNTNANIQCCTLRIGNKYTVKTSNYNISVTKFINEMYKIKIKDRRTNHVKKITGIVAEYLYFKLYTKFWSMHTGQR